ncbi:MAG: GMP synthase [Chitinophagaceae bacterium]|nr:GMP synthase [Chitinophagaceae bacterium]
MTKHKNIYVCPMNGFESRKLRIAVLDLYQGEPNEGMRGIRTLLHDWSSQKGIELYAEEFDVRLKNELPDLSFDIYISSGGPGSPLSTRYDDWDIAWCRWLNEVERWNANPSNYQKKHVFFICHSFQLACRYFDAGIVCKRKSTAFGIFPVHMLEDAFDDPVLAGLSDPFYAVDSRDFQVIQPNHARLRQMGGKVLCIEKIRPHVPLERAVMAIRFNDYMIGTQFHPEADVEGMRRYLVTEEKRKTVIENHGIEKLQNMLDHLEDPDKIMWTYSHVIPNFLNSAIQIEEMVS